MHVLIASDRPATSSRLQHSLATLGHECTPGQIVSLETAAQIAVAKKPGPDVVIAVLPADKNRSVSMLQRLREVTRATIIAVGTAQQPSEILDAIHAGAHDFLDEQGDIATQLGQSLQRNCRSTETEKKTGQLIVITGASGGSGASVLSSNLAVALATQHGSCALLDLCMRQGDQAALLNVKPRHTVIELSRNVHKLDLNILKQSLVEHRTGLHLLAAPQQLEDADSISRDAINRIVRLTQSAFSHVVADLGVHPEPCVQDLLGRAERILLLVRLDFTSVRSARLLLQRFSRVGIDAARIEMVASRVGQPNELPLAKAEQVLGVKMTCQIPEDIKTVNRCVNCGVPAVVDSPNSKFAKRVTDLTSELSGRSTPVVNGQQSQRVGDAPAKSLVTGWIQRSKEWLQFPENAIPAIGE